jgi:eukaryotic-like serine/threonine-protein kinase
MPERAEPGYELGPFRLDATQRLLFRDGELVPLSPKALETLLLLVRNHGQLVEKDELLRQVWPNLVVEESNLAIQISQLRKTLSGPMGADPIDTIPRRGYRFVGSVRPASAAAEPAAASAAPPEHAAQEPGAATARHGTHLMRWLIVAVLAVLAVFGLVRWRLPVTPGAAHRASVLTVKDHVLLADVQNDTGEAVFDSTLRQALTIQLEQSPFLTLVSDQEIERALTLMNQPKTAPLTHDLAWELCRRTASGAVIYESIATLGSQYVLGLRAVSCRTGDTLADEQLRASGKDQVLHAVDDGATRLRTRLGESLAQVQRYNAPVEQVTTPSFAALEAYSQGWLMNYRRADPAGAISFFQQAIALDPDFAMAYAALGQTYSNLYEPTEAARYLQRAYAFRGRVSQRERFYIESRYQRVVTGDLEKARLINQQWAEVYPRDAVPHASLALIDRFLGHYQRALSEASAALRLAPDAAQSYANLSFSYLLLNRLAEAKAVARDAQGKNLDSPLLRLNLYFIAYLEKDRNAAAELEAWSVGQAGVEDRFLEDEALQNAHAGQVVKARALSERAVAAALHAGTPDVAAGYAAQWAVIEALLGDAGAARRDATAALKLSADRDARYSAALAFALAREEPRARSLVESLNQDFPEDTAVQFCYLPTLRAALALVHGDGAQALSSLEPTRPYELGKVTELYPVFLRGQAYLEEHQAAQALAEFQKILALPGVVTDDPIGALAHLESARARAMQGSPAAARAEYQAFLALWQGASPAPPLLMSARAELAHLDAPHAAMTPAAHR